MQQIRSSETDWEKLMDESMKKDIGRMIFFYMYHKLIRDFHHQKTVELREAITRGGCGMLELRC